MASDYRIFKCMIVETCRYSQNLHFFFQDLGTVQNGQGATMQKKKWHTKFSFYIKLFTLYMLHWPHWHFFLIYWFSLHIWVWVSNYATKYRTSCSSYRLLLVRFVIFDFLGGGYSVSYVFIFLYFWNTVNAFMKYGVGVSWFRYRMGI